MRWGGGGGGGVEESKCNSVSLSMQIFSCKELFQQALDSIANVLDGVVVVVRKISVN